MSDYAVTLSALLPDSLIVTPQSDKTHKNSAIREWYDVSDYDIERKRRNPETPLDEIIDIYDRAGEQLEKCALKMNNFIDVINKDYSLTDCNIYIIGFSQGAMLALWTALSRKQSIGGCFMFSGVVAGHTLLAQNIHSRPQIFMLHGEDDTTVQYKTLDFSMNWLTKHNLEVEVVRYPDTAHRITENELKFAAGIIASQRIIKVKQ